jgi:hypothetical protein
MPIMPPPDWPRLRDRQGPACDYTVYTGECEVGRIYKTRGAPDSLRWFWFLTVNGPMTRSGRVATLEEGQGAVSEELRRWKAWAKVEEIP